MDHSFPIYVNKYAFGQVGPLFEIDDALTDIMIRNLTRYLGLLYGGSAGEQSEIVKHPEVPYKVLYDNGKSEMWLGRKCRPCVQCEQSPVAVIADIEVDHFGGTLTRLLPNVLLGLLAAGEERKTG